MANPSFASTGICRCGSRLHNKLDYQASKHSAICRRRGHESPLGPAWVPVPRDFVCPCGGLYVPDGPAIVVRLPAGPAPIFKRFSCPSCFGRLQVFAPPAGGARPSTNPAMLEIMRAEDSVLSALRTAGPAVRVIQEIERQFGKRYGAMETLARNVMLGWPEDAPPPPDHPLRVEFLAIAAKAATQLF